LFYLQLFYITWFILGRDFPNSFYNKIRFSSNFRILNLMVTSLKPYRFLKTYKVLILEIVIFEEVIFVTT